MHRWKVSCGWACGWGLHGKGVLETPPSFLQLLLLLSRTPEQGGPGSRGTRGLPIQHPLGYPEPQESRKEIPRQQGWFSIW